MKTLVFLIASVFAANTIIAQQEFLAGVNITKLFKELKTVNRPSLVKEKSNYIRKTEHLNFSRKIGLMQHLISNYDITKNAIYDNSEKARYDVKFKEKSSRAYLVYNNEGEILSSKECYRNIVLPLKLKLKILQNNPMFSISRNKVTVTYKRNLGLAITYEVTIYNGRKRQTLIFDKNYNVI